MSNAAPRRVVITGASRGIGAAIANEFAEFGVELILVARSTDALNEVLRDCERKGATGFVITADLSSVDSATELADRILERSGPPDLLILNAGVSNDSDFLSSASEGASREIGVNYIAPVALLRRLLPKMQDRDSSIVAVSSLTVHLPFPGNSTYAASKAALFSLLRSLRLELSGSPVHVGAVLPGYTETEMTKGFHTPLTAMSPARVAKAVRKCAEQRRRVVIPGLFNRIAARVFRNMPEVGDRLAARVGHFVFRGPSERGCDG